MLPFLVLFLLHGGLLCRAAVTERASTSISISTAGSYTSSPLLYGLMYEDINRSGDGGLYGELLMNRAFQGVSPGTPDSLEAWSTFGGSQIAVIADPAPVSSALPNTLQVTVPSSAAAFTGFTNDGYWGMKIERGKAYKASFYAKLNSTSVGPIKVSLVSSTGTTLASASVPALTTSWKQYTLSLVPSIATSNSNNTFSISFGSSQAKGKAVNFAMFSLFPPTFKGRENGMRADLAQTLADLKPSFFRFPGGNNLEGRNIPEFWNWTLTVGPLVDRPGRMGTWSYYNTDGLGLLEYLYWCEDLNAVPIMGVYAGYSLDGTSVPEAELGPYVQLAIDQVHFAIGDPRTNKWAALRAKYGRVAPFKVEYIEIGNEDHLWNAPATYAAYRWKAFHDALLAEFPNLKIIATTLYNDPVLTPTPKYDDMHIYETPTWFIESHDIYKDRSIYPLTGAQIFEGEFAVTSTNSSCLFGPVSCGRLPYPTLQGSVAEATFMAGLERDSNVVFAAAYAPILNHISASQWMPNLITFDADTITLSSSYYVQQMFSVNRGDKILSSSVTGAKNPLYWVVSQKTSAKKVFVKLTNIGPTATPLGLVFTNLKIKSSGRATILTHSIYDIANTPTAPNNIIPTIKQITASSNFEYKVPGYSVVVLDLNYQ